MYYERQKHSGEMPIIGVNTFRNPDADFDALNATLELARSTDEEKNEQIARLAAFHDKHKDESVVALERLKEVALSGGNVFAELLDTVKYCSLGQISNALYSVGGQYRRNM
jgi:methylmalonyl-CoA mutase